MKKYLRAPTTRVTITANRTIGRDGSTTNRSFAYRGSISGRNLSLSWVQAGSNNTVCGALVLRVAADFQQMTGVTSYFSDSEGGVVSNKIYYKARI